MLSVNKMFKDLYHRSCDFYQDTKYWCVSYNEADCPPSLDRGYEALTENLTHKVRCSLDEQSQCQLSNPSPAGFFAHKHTVAQGPQLVGRSVDPEGSAGSPCPARSKWSCKSWELLCSVSCRVPVSKHPGLIRTRFLKPHV